MGDLLSLATYLEGLNDSLPTLASTVARECADAIANDLVVHTPVDTGEAMSGWQVTLDEPATDVRPAFAPSPKGKMVKGKWTHKVAPAITQSANLGSAQAEIESALESKQPGQLIFITNNEPYIVRLNDGISEQEPAGFVDRAVILAEQIVQKAQVI